MLSGLKAKAVNLYVSGVQWDRNSVLALLPLINCAGCGQCCIKCKDILVQNNEMVRIKEHLGYQPPMKRKTDKGWIMSTPCQFRTKYGCSIHGPIMPVVCKYFPLQKLHIPEGDVVGVFTEFCKAGLPVIEQLEAWERGV